MQSETNHVCSSELATTIMSEPQSAAEHQKFLFESVIKLQQCVILLTVQIMILWMMLVEEFNARCFISVAIIVSLIRLVSMLMIEQFALSTLTS